MIVIDLIVIRTTLKELKSNSKVIRRLIRQFSCDS